MTNKREIKTEKPRWEKLLPWAIVIVVVLYLGGMNAARNANHSVENKQVTETSEQRQEREKAEAENLEAKKNDQATAYCSERADDSTSYYIIKVQEENGDLSTDYNSSVKKQGPALTQTDCREIIDALYKWKVSRIQDIVGRMYWIGMDRFSLIASVGQPNKINSSDYGSGQTEQWVYYKDSYGISSVYIYLDSNEKVTSYQDF